MLQHQHTLRVSTRGRGLYDVTAQVSAWLRDQNVELGLLSLFLQHTSASLIVQENADPDVLGDLERFFARLVPDDDALYRHTAEGPDDMPAHVRAALTQTQLSLPVGGGKPMLGTWQALYVYEHRHAAHVRSLVLHYVGT